MTRWIAALLLLLTPLSTRAEGTAGDFDYYVMALSWSPSWCLLEGDARDAAQCDPAADAGWVLHGLWPQYEEGWPDWCDTSRPNPSRAQSAAMADIMGEAGSAFYQWRKHGRCSGLSGAQYYALSRDAYDRIERPALLRRIERPLRLAPSVIEAAFLEANPSLTARGITITCTAGRIAEARICLSRDLTPRPCGRDVSRDCAAPANFPPVR